MDQGPRLSRREVIAGAAVAGAAFALPVTPVAARSRRRVDVVVVGAGLAGLTAARRLARHHRSVLVLEARDRVGGRTLNHPIGDGQAIEAGGEFVGPTQDRVLALAKELGVGTYKTYNAGSNVLISQGARSTYPAVPGIPDPPEDPQVFKDVLNALGKYDELGAEVGVKAPWKATRARALDHETVEQYANEIYKSTRLPGIQDVALESIFGRDGSALSLLFTAFYVASAGNAKNAGSFARLISTAGGAQESRLVGGSQLLALRMADALAARVVLRTPVRRIAQTRSGVTVVADNVTVDAKQAIVAIPPLFAHGIRYSPALPTTHRRMLARFHPGDMIKAQLIYDRPWWRDKGYSGQLVVDSGPAGVTYDNTPESGAPGVILGFIGGRQAARYRALGGLDARRQAFVDELAAGLGDEARSPRDYFEMDWTAEPWTRGCPTASTAPGVLSRYGAALRAPAGRIRFAGTETADFWTGYMDGAIRSGERVAAEVLNALEPRK